MEEPEKLERIVEARLKLKVRFEQQMQATPISRGRSAERLRPAEPAWYAHNPDRADQNGEMARA